MLRALAFVLLAVNARAWTFAVSGDSRNCGDLVMPAIAAAARKDGAAFFWHLGDFRWTMKVDQDILHQPRYLRRPPSLGRYHAFEWDDFVSSQIEPFGKTPVYLGIGNHETLPPKTRAQYIKRFRAWRPRDAADRTYYQWVRAGVAFISLDNATAGRFDAAQLNWFERTLKNDEADAALTTIVVGMHEALPESIASGRSMMQSGVDTSAGKRVYEDLVLARDLSRKRVYVLASHAHLFMSGIFNTEYWRTRGAVLPGWIVGTAGATSHPLPPGWGQAKEAATGIYGYLLGRVADDGTVSFAFKRLRRRDVPAAVRRSYGAPFVRWCFEKNRRLVP